MPKTIAITPSWYWPPGIPRVVGVPTFSIPEMCVDRPARDNPSAPALVAGQARLSAAGLRDEVGRTAAAIKAAAGGSPIGVLSAGASLDSVVLFLAALAAGLHVRLVPPTVDAVADAAARGGFALDPSLRGGSAEMAGKRAPSLAELREGAIILGGESGPVVHSHRSLMAAAISLSAFLDAAPGRPWMPLIPLSRWEGILSVLTPLFLGAPVVLPPDQRDPEAVVRTITQENVGYTYADLPAAAQMARDAKKAAKDARKVLEAFLLGVDGMFDPDERRRVSRSLECPALTVWGTPATGPVFASHASWYVDESVGIPITNAHVVPADPRTGEPIQALWELVDSAEVTVWSPSLLLRTEGADDPARWAGSRFRTGMMASSDANGMIYLLGGQP
jgi:acyl-CoA synthetase (AMP-forming)/AMP-acid ligase II